MLRPPKLVSDQFSFNRLSWIQLTCLRWSQLSSAAELSLLIIKLALVLLQGARPGEERAMGEMAFWRKIDGGDGAR